MTKKHATASLTIHNDRANVIPMNTENNTNPAESIDSGSRRKYSDMSAKPIMIYPQSAEQRELFEAAARADNRKLSPFIVHVVMQFIKAQEMSGSPEGRLEEARKRLMQRTA